MFLNYKFFVFIIPFNKNIIIQITENKGFIFSFVDLKQSFLNVPLIKKMKQIVNNSFKWFGQIFLFFNLFLLRYEAS
jgi:hypothetical protein